MNRLLHVSIASGTHKTYNTGWEVFCQFRQQTSCGFPDQPARAIDVRRFIACLFLRSKAPNTIATYVAAVSYMHKMQNWSDPNRDFLVTNYLKGAAVFVLPRIRGFRFPSQCYRQLFGPFQLFAHHFMRLSCLQHHSWSQSLVSCE